MSPLPIFIPPERQPPERPPNRLQRLVDDELIALEMRALQLKTQRNGYADISKLPDEILLEIFTILKDASPLESWFKINMVCRHWRYVAVEAPGLWSDPPTNLHELTMVMLGRSKMCDLHVKLNDGTSPATTTAVLDHVGRIRSLSIDQNFTNLTKTQGLFRSSGRALRLDKLIVACKRCLPHLAFSAFAFHTLDQLLSLELSTVHLDWDILPLPNLTFLSLTNIGLSGLLSCHKFLETMHYMPSLRKIVLDFDVLSQIISKTMAPKTVELPHLSSLEARDATPGQIEYILTHLTLPRLQHLDICCIDRSADDNDDYSSFMQVISKILINGDFGTLDCLVITDSYHFQLVPQESSTPAGLDFLLPYIDGVNDNSHPIRETMAGFSPQILERLSQVDLTCCMSIPDPLFSSFFGSLPSLRSICIEDELTEAIIESLNISTDRPPSAARISFPKLEEVIFRSASLSRSMLERLRRCLTIRCALGAALSMLAFEFCTIGRDGLDLLKVAGLRVISSDIDFVDEE